MNHCPNCGADMAHSPCCGRAAALASRVPGWNRIDQTRKTLTDMGRGPVVLVGYTDESVDIRPASWVACVATDHPEMRPRPVVWMRIPPVPEVPPQPSKSEVVKSVVSAFQRYMSENGSCVSHNALVVALSNLTNMEIGEGSSTC